MATAYDRQVRPLHGPTDEAMETTETLVVVSDGGLVQKIEALPGGQGVLAQALR